MSFAQMTNDEMGIYRVLQEKISNDLRVALPAKIVSFDPTTQTASVQPMITDTILMGDKRESMTLPVLSDVPVQFPRGGDFFITLPVTAGDTCLLIFADRCIDGFFQSGQMSGQSTVRSHDLSDALALVGFSTGADPVPSYSTDKLEIRNKDSLVSISVSKEEIKVTAPKVDINGTVF